MVWEFLDLVLWVVLIGVGVVLLWFSSKKWGVRFRS